MRTKIIKIAAQNPEISQIKKAVKILEKEGLVAFPTETVYGLGANALNKKAVKKIFEAKGRPTDNPLIVHISDKNEIYKLAREVPEQAKILINKLWPGPLTVILKKSFIVPDIITGGLDTVAIRMPSNKIALSLIKEAKVPIAAPSANFFGKPSPTEAKHVLKDLNGRIEAVIDGGSTDIGVESTVIDCTTNPPTLLRPGGITLEEIKKWLEEIAIHPITQGKQTQITEARSPGMKYRHYSPEAKLIIVEEGQKKIQELTDYYRLKGKFVGIMTVIENNTYKAESIKFLGKDMNAIAKNLFRILREFDEEKIDIIISEMIANTDLGHAIMNRLKKASDSQVTG